jgi:hypothetical protein
MLRASDKQKKIFSHTYYFLLSKFDFVPKVRV